MVLNRESVKVKSKLKLMLLSLLKVNVVNTDVNVQALTHLLQDHQEVSPFIVFQTTQLDNGQMKVFQFWTLELSTKATQVIQL